MLSKAMALFSTEGSCTSVCVSLQNREHAPASALALSILVGIHLRKVSGPQSPRLRLSLLFWFRDTRPGVRHLNHEPLRLNPYPNNLITLDAQLLTQKPQPPTPFPKHKTKTSPQPLSTRQTEDTSLKHTTYSLTQEKDISQTPRADIRDYDETLDTTPLLLGLGFRV